MGIYVGNIGMTKGAKGEQGIQGEQGDAGSGDANTINSDVALEPTGSNVVPNIVWMTQTDYDAAVIATTIVPNTLYAIK